MAYVIGVDVGATKIHAGLITTKGQLVKEYKTLTEADKPKEIILGKIKHAIKEVWSEDVLGIGIGIPGPVDYKHKKAYPPNISSLNGIKFESFLKEFKVPSIVGNDSDCFVVAEHTFGSAKKFSNVLGITLGTGVGGGLITDNRLYTGRDGAAGEIGHVTIDRQGYLCNCGNHGCLEMYASGTAIEMRAKRHIKIKDIPTRLKEDELTAMKVHFAALKKDKLAKKVMDDTGLYLGIGVASLLNVLNPDVLILGGSVSKALPSFEKTLKKTIKERTMKPAKKAKILQSKMKHAGTIGAGALIIRKLNIKNKTRKELKEEGHDKTGGKDEKGFFRFF